MNGRLLWACVTAAVWAAVAGFAGCRLCVGSVAHGGCGAQAGTNTYEARLAAAHEALEGANADLAALRRQHGTLTQEAAAATERARALEGKAKELGATLEEERATTVRALGHYQARSAFPTVSGQRSGWCPCSCYMLCLCIVAGGYLLRGALTYCHGVDACCFGWHAGNCTERGRKWTYQGCDGVVRYVTQNPGEVWAHRRTSCMVLCSLVSSLVS